MSHENWRLGFHIAPRHAWLNDPNGLCQFRGSYYAFFQYNPKWPEADTKYWRQFKSDDLVHWKDCGTALVTDISEDRNGVYSGSALIKRGEASDGGDLMCLYYTGNVIDANDPEHSVGFVHSGRDANEILVTSEDGEHYSEKMVLLRNSDYPSICTRHVRDPKVWEQDGSLYMLLGARDQNDEGFVLLYKSSDGNGWHIHSQIYSRNPFGYMWECPNIVQIDGFDYLAVCPQGLPSERDRWQNRWQAGYFPVCGSILTTHLVDETTFVEWDHGHDFYAPQVFVDDAGRTILIGWMGTFDHHYTATPDGLEWAHCLTVPREITRAGDGLLKQWPVAELEALRGDPFPLDPGDRVTFDSRMADLVFEGVSGRGGSLALDEALGLAFDGASLTVRFLDDEVAAGRRDRFVPVYGGVHSLRVLVDRSAIEVYVNGGEHVLSVRWFPKEGPLWVRSDIMAQQAFAYPMEDAMADAYDDLLED